MNWKKILKAHTDFTVRPEGLLGPGEWSEKLNKDKIGGGWTGNQLIGFNKELAEIADALERLGITIEFAALWDEMWGESGDRRGSDGMYLTENEGIACKITYKDKEKILYFEVPMEGYWGEDGERPIYHIPSVLEEEEVFVDVVLHALGFGKGPSKDPDVGSHAQGQADYLRFYESLSRDERDSGKYRAPNLDWSNNPTGEY